MSVIDPGSDRLERRSPLAPIATLPFARLSPGRRMRATRWWSTRSRLAPMNYVPSRAKWPRVEWTSISALCDDLTQHVERLVSRRKSRVGSYLEQCLTQLLHGPPEVQRAAQVRLELFVVSGGGEHRHHH